jgi:5,10-methylenetetrahydromethanopterin reductase
VTDLPAFGLNRLAFASPQAFAADAQRAESLGWDYALVPSSPLRLRDPYVLLAAAAQATERIRLGPMLDTPVLRHPVVTASSIATIDEIAGGRAILGYGVGGVEEVRSAGRGRATVAELERAATLIRLLLHGGTFDLGAREPGRLRHARPVPLWIAAGGPRTLRMAGRAADGVLIRVGTDARNLRAAAETVRAGAVEAGRDPTSVRIGALFHTIMAAGDRAMTAGRAVAAGYYELTPALFDRAAIPWDGPEIASLRERVYPDFHHAPDIEAAGALVEFLPDEAVDAFALCGSTEQIAQQLREIVSLDIPLDLVVPHPVRVSAQGQGGPERPDFAELFAREVLGRLR